MVLAGSIPALRNSGYYPEARRTVEGRAEQYEQLTSYRFNTDAIDHAFCQQCGIESLARGADAEGSHVVTLNVACLEGAPDIDRAGDRYWDGRNR